MVLPLGEVPLGCVSVLLLPVPLGDAVEPDVPIEPEVPLGAVAEVPVEPELSVAPVDPVVPLLPGLLGVLGVGVGVGVGELGVTAPVSPVPSTGRALPLVVVLFRSRQPSAAAETANEKSNARWNDI